MLRHKDGTSPARLSRDAQSCSAVTAERLTLGPESGPRLPLPRGHPWALGCEAAVTAGPPGLLRELRRKSRDRRAPSSPSLASASQWCSPSSLLSTLGCRVCDEGGS